MTFKEVEDRFIHKLDEFAKGGYRFNDQYTLYKQSQQEGFQGYLDGISAGDTHGYIELPTGVGKTALFISLIKNYLDAANGEENAPRVLIAVPTEKLAVQTAQAFAKFMPDIAKTIEADGDKGQEIDWGKSDIGLQYGKMKHAHKKPKVLITTYQSLAQDKENKVYSPQDFGFVIYDEGHVITAPAFGKAVDKFHDSIQLAVTATPEYTETKTVAARLPHRYYQLPLAEAINNGDLCNVRPAIIKTGYKLDEAMFQRFMEQQGGTPLNSQQLQQLLNQEARNKAVIETYMRGVDPDSGERYFGQNGMIFCTGIKHTDAIAAQFTKEMGHGEGIKLKNWLDEENVELIASVHGNAKGQWLKKGLIQGVSADSRQYQGNREWYSEQEIFDLHEKGKILLLASVAKLKAGYDSPRDSLLFDLADRFSKVDATQIDGRAFRLDPENPNKTATVFNLMDENTQALYDKFPKMIPIYSAEVIEGAEFRPPARRTGAQIRFKEPPPGMEATLQEAGFDIVTNIDAVRTISRDNRTKRDKALLKAPEKTDEWLGIRDMSLQSGKAYATISPIYIALQDAWKTAKDAGEESFTANGITWPVDKAGMFKSGSSTVFCLQKEAASLFTTQNKTEAWLSAKDTVKQVGEQVRINAAYKDLETAWEKAKAAGDDTFTANGITLPVAMAGFFKAGSQTPFCLNHVAIKFLVAPDKTDEWMSKTELCTRAKRASLASTFDALQSAWEKAKLEGSSTFTAEGITLPIEKGGIYKSRVNLFCIHQDTLPLFAAPEITSEWVSSKGMTNLGNTSEKAVVDKYRLLHAAWEKAKADGKEEFTAEDITLPVGAGQMFGTGKSSYFCLHKDAIPYFSKPEKTSEWLSQTDMTERARKSSTTISPLYAKLQNAWKQAVTGGEDTFSAEGVTIATNRAGMFKSPRGDIFCLHQDTVPLFATPQKNQDWLVRAEIKTRVKKDIPAKTFDALQQAWDIAKAAGKDTFTAEGITLPVNKAGIFQSGKMTAFCLHEDVVESIKNAFAKGRTSFVELVGSKPDIKPGSDHLKRVGLVLGKKED